MTKHDDIWRADLRFFRGKSATEYRLHSERIEEIDAKLVIAMELAEGSLLEETLPYSSRPNRDPFLQGIQPCR